MGWLVVVVAATTMLTCAVGGLIKVGGRDGWTQNVNYTQWAAHQRFYVGDWLYFVFDKHYYSVLEVNQSSYEKCNDVDFIRNITRGGRDVFNLTEAKPYYFLSSGGYCYNGMKLAIDVEQLAPSPNPSSSSSSSSVKNGASQPRSHGNKIAVLLVVALIFRFSF